MKILLLCNKSPWPPKEGGPMAMNMMVEGLIQEGHTVKVVAVNSFKYNISPDDIPEDYQQKTGIELIDTDLRIKPLPAFVHLIMRRSYHISRFVSKRFTQRISEILSSETFDVIQLETLFMAPYIETIRNHSEAPIVLRAHNIEYKIWERIAESTTNPLKRWYIHQLAQTLQIYEKNACLKVDGIVAITQKDATYFADETKQMDGHSPSVISIPFGIDLNKYPKPKNPGQPASLCTIGSMNWIPNAEGVRWFLHHVWPEVHKTLPHTTYYLAGREMPEWMKRLKMPGVKVVGEVEDAQEFLLKHGIMVVPLFSGSGIRVKIIEAMALGRAIVSTSIGAEGIDYNPGENLLISNLPCDFAEMVSWCLRDNGIREKLGKNARVLAENHYDESSLISKLISFYRQLSR
jgi:polysaccharide biosynthesis protein PslH